MISRVASVLLALVVSGLGCFGRAEDSSLAGTEDCPQFLGTRLVATDGSLGPRGVTEWSANDDVDSLFVVVASEPSTGARQLVIEAGLRPVRLADDVVDTTLRYVSVANVAIRELLPLGDSRRVWRVRPSALDSIAGAKGDERTLKVRAAVHLSGRSVCERSVDILPLM